MRRVIAGELVIAAAILQASFSARKRAAAAAG
jgi:hypothetical protein